MNDSPLDVLRSTFGLDHFRVAQRDVIDAVLGGRDTLCVMPTGAGKSLCFQLPAVVRGGLSVVVSPLISLMEDQCRQLKTHGISAAFLNSSLSASQQRQTLEDIDDGFEGLLYVSPERCQMNDFAAAVARRKPTLLAIDEAHCISQWGHDFRPEYSMLGGFRDRINNPPTIATTATATDDVRADIIRGLSLSEPAIFITGFDRPNLSYESFRLASDADRLDHLFRIISNTAGTGIVYCSTRKAVDELAVTLARQLKDRVIVAYHAGMDMGERVVAQRRFMAEDSAIAVATTAFGMGINKPDVRFVVHFNLPGTIEQYYQEAGRAGRDGKPAVCTILYRPADRTTQAFFIDKLGEGNDNLDFQTVQRLRRSATDKLELMVAYATGHRCRRQMILDYFGDETEVENCTCDVCRRGEVDDREVEIDDETLTLIRQLLSGVARLNGRFGIGAVSELLAGVDGERAAKFEWNRWPTFGLLKSHSQKQIREWMNRLIEAGLVRQIDPDRAFRPVLELTAAGSDVMKGSRKPPGLLADLRGVVVRERGRKSKSKSDKPDISVDLDSDALARFEKLRAARLKLSKEQGVPAYVVCHDATLKLIAVAAPDSIDDLSTIKGMGPMKVKLYGQALIDAVRA